ncbi:MAG: transcription factor IIB [Candidatus Methylarchaceae archaeon HK01M]|nr:transcription factor IIB [Candidatus Methylarchaceae archaeon HK01M]
MERRNRSSQKSCPFCGKSIIGDCYRGELICSSCGFVVEDHNEYQGPEWKAMDLEEKQRKVRVGAPRTLSLHDNGLTTVIGTGLKDSHGISLSPYMRMSIKKMKKWQKRIRTASSEERSLSAVLSKINEISNNLNLPKTVTETAAHTYRILAKKKVAKSRSIMGMAGASIYLACRKCRVSRSLKEVSRATNADKRTIAKYYRLVLKETEKEYVPPLSLGKYISKLVNTIKIDPKVERLAIHLMSEISNSKIFDGKAPAGIAASFVYISSMLSGAHVPQREIAEAAEVTEVTIRNRSREILNNFMIRQYLKVIPKDGDEILADRYHKSLNLG